MTPSPQVCARKPFEAPGSTFEEGAFQRARQVDVKAPLANPERAWKASRPEPSAVPLESEYSLSSANGRTSLPLLTIVGGTVGHEVPFTCSWAMGLQWH